MNYQSILEKFADVKVLIVGDVMLDRYWWGSVSRISPEAPVPVVKLEKVTMTAGGAANVAANVTGLGAKSFLVGAIGDDESGRNLPQILDDCDVSSEYLIKFVNRPTTTKTRVIAHQQQVARIDEEFASPLDDMQQAEMWSTIERLLPKINVVILSDYAKGCLCDELLSKIILTARKLKKPVLVDPKGKDYKKYNGANVITPNRIEAAAASGIEIIDETSLDAAGEKLFESLSIENLLITLGEDGMRLFERGAKSKHFASRTRKVYDVTGAGDTVIATLAIALGVKIKISDAVQIANAAAGLAVESVGTTFVKLKDLSEVL
ncbi:MAG: D-glycero-beta-D-manno-heptose-7-phosphate kinase [Pyrinomonadaceae bacterium]|nr:D-glycero-beta-D-manno-heptose-7-phosphate kinase [Pyrinomonadaceae bacterium]